MIIWEQGGGGEVKDQRVKSKEKPQQQFTMDIKETDSQISTKTERRSHRKRRIISKSLTAIWSERDAE